MYILILSQNESCHIVITTCVGQGPLELIQIRVVLEKLERSGEYLECQVRIPKQGSWNSANKGELLSIFSSPLSYHDLTKIRVILHK